MTSQNEQDVIFLQIDEYKMPGNNKQISCHFGPDMKT